jgi:copper chaperone NosL
MRTNEPVQQTVQHTTTRPSRRVVLASLGVGLAAAVAGCTKSSTTRESIPDPIALDGGKQDDQGGMVIGDHFGPNGQIFYRKNSPERHENPAWFHTLTAGLFPYYFEHRRLGWEAVAIYVTDYSIVDFDLIDEAGKTYISTHTAADTFGFADEMMYVAGSGVLGGMGKELIPFSEDADAEAFVDTHGGSTVDFDTITAEWLGDYLQR